MMTSGVPDSNSSFVRQKVWHHKTRDGCFTCRARRVKCDEGRPECQNCSSRNRKCAFPNQSRQSHGLSSVVSNHVYWYSKPVDRQDLQFYLCSGAPMLAKWQCPSLWLKVLPRAGDSCAAIMHTVLTTSAFTRLFVITTPSEVEAITRRGDVHYARACSMITAEITLEDALTGSLALWAYDWFLGRQAQSFVHAHAAIKLLKSLESGHSNEWPSDLSNQSRESMLEVARAWFRDIHFPLHNKEFLRMVERAAQKCLGQAVDLKRPSPLTHPFADLATPAWINSFFWVILVADSKQELYIIQQALDYCVQGILQQPMPRSNEQKIFSDQLELFQLMCEYHLCDESDRSSSVNDRRMSRMLDLMQQIMGTASGKPIEVPVQPRSTTQGWQCYAGLFGLISQQASDPKIRERAFDQLANNGSEH